MSRLRLTKSRLRALKPRARAYELSCARHQGLVVRVLPSGKKVFLVRFREGARYRRVRLGLWETDLDLDEARARTRELVTGEAAPARASARPQRHSIARVKRGRGSAVEQPRPTDVPTVRQLADKFMREYAEVYLSAGTVDGYRRSLEKHILPALGDRPFDTVTRRDAKALHVMLSDRRGVADNTINALGSLYSRIIDDWELSDMRNPTAGVRRFGSRRVERFLTPAERCRLERTLQEGLRVPKGRKGHLNTASVWAIRLLSLTGLRRGEVLGLEWPMVNWQHSALYLPTTKTGQRTVVVSAQVMALLREIHEATGQRSRGLVLRGINGNKLSGFSRTWHRVRETAEIPDVRIHDLRHSFASDALMSGVPLAVVGSMLGHRKASTTQRYAHLSSDVVRAALAKTTARIIDAVGKADPTEPEFVPMSDAQWERVGPLVEATRKRGGPTVDLRAAVDGIRWVLERKAKWRQLPERFGAPTTTWRWYKRWLESGVWAEVESLL